MSFWGDYTPAEKAEMKADWHKTLKCWIIGAIIFGFIGLCYFFEKMG
jgi:hypothetical protein